VNYVRRSSVLKGEDGEGGREEKGGNVWQSVVSAESLNFLYMPLGICRENFFSLCHQCFHCSRFPFGERRERFAFASEAKTFIWQLSHNSAFPAERRAGKRTAENSRNPNLLAAILASHPPLLGELISPSPATLNAPLASIVAGR